MSDLAQHTESAELVRLLAATAAGDRRAFALLYERTSPHLFGLLLRMVLRRDWAEEALQDCYLRIWQKAEGYAPERGTPMAWLATIARYRALDLLRARRPEVPEDELPLAAADPGPAPYERAEIGEGLGRLGDCLQRLEASPRRSVLLAYYAGYTHAELARRLGAPLGTVKSWVRRGLQQLRDCLGAA